MSDDESTDTPVNDKAPYEWKTSVPDDHFSYFNTGTTSLVLRSLETQVLDKKTQFSTDKLYVYAETIKIAEDISFPGRELGLFCNRLELGSECVSVSVAGKKGIDESPTSSISSDGTSAGKIILYVEEFDDAIVPAIGAKKGLFLRAHGGDGGRGRLNIGTGDPRGSPGGSGGNGGSIHVYLGHPLLDTCTRLSALLADPSHKWISKLKAFQGADLGFSNANHDLKMAIEQSSAHTDTLRDIGQIVGFLNFESAPQDVLTEEHDRKLSEAIELFQSLPQEPRVADTTIKAMRGCFEIVNTLRQAVDGAVTADQWKEYQDRSRELLEVLGEATGNPWPANESPAGKAMHAAVNSLEDRVSYIAERMEMVYSCDGGQGGPGGAGALPDSPGSNGKPGDNGDPPLVKLLRFSGLDEDLTIPYVLAHPDQCQMVLNQIDLRYFQASGGTYKETVKGSTLFEAGRIDTPERFKAISQYYERIEKRLRFMSPLQRQRANLSQLDTNDLSQYALFMAYGEMEKEFLLLCPLPQLLQLQAHTHQRLDWITTGKDFMGQAGTWVPRLSYSYYNEQLQGYMGEALALVKSFQDTRASTALDLNTMKTTLSQASATLKSLETRIELLTNKDKGELPALASHIEAFTPLLKRKRQELSEAVASVKKSMKRYNWDPRIIIDAMSMIAFAPCPWNAGAQVTSATFKGFTTVSGLDGQVVERNYLVSQFGTAGTTLEELGIGYKSASNGTLEVDDPGAAKLLSTKADLDKLTNNFLEAIGEEAYGSISFKLGEYVSLVQSRNSAVMSYNAVVQLLVKAYADRTYHEQKAQKLGQVLLSINPRATSVRHYFTKCLYDLRSDILTAMHQGKRALEFWGLYEDTKPMPCCDDFSEIALLSTYNKQFKKAFDEVMHRYRATNPGYIFPPPENLGAGGKCFYLSKKDCGYVIAHPREVTLEPSSLGKPPVMGKVYQFPFKIPPVRSWTRKTADKPETEMSGSADIRLDNVRVWIFGAHVDPSQNGTRELSMTLRHLGNDSIVPPSDKQVYEFTHDSIDLSFGYDPETVKSYQDTATARITRSAALPSYRREVNSKEVDWLAPFGPFADWVLYISDWENIGLRFDPDTTVCVEFWGQGRPFTNKK
ncbi:hypothetical protein CDV36_004487 [Fusarium kuroshium]|uniref:Uncharacterized protein n=1 Tax=Fusarium kuroshium TaxID=2010991 RepID=A0A3M2SE70_9HYPO|nr:hypothetical protein CDV36_004487 [Fusarium kuroshium]